MGKELAEVGEENVVENKQPEVTERAEESPVDEIVKENFSLQIKIKEQEHELKARDETLMVFKEYNFNLNAENVKVKEELSSVNDKLVKTSKNATAYLVSGICVTVVLLLFVVLVAN